MTSKDANHQAAKVLYDLEMGLWEMDMSKLSYDEAQDCFRFRDGRFAFSTAVFTTIDPQTVTCIDGLLVEVL